MTDYSKEQLSDNTGMAREDIKRLVIENHELTAKIARLSTRGIKDMQHEIKTLTAGNIKYRQRAEDAEAQLAKYEVLYQDGQPCKHKGCARHITHPCEHCGRVGCKGVVYITLPEKEVK